MVTVRSGLSAGVRTREVDISDHVNNQVSTVSMLIGVAQKGPAFKIDIVPTERDYVDTYGEPDSDTAKTFFAASTYFTRGANLLFTRVVDRPRAIVAAVGFDANSDNEPDGTLPTIANLDPEIYNNDVTEYAEASDDTIVDQADVEAYYNSQYKCVQAFYSRHTLNRAFPRERLNEYEVGDLVHDGWYEDTESGEVEHFSGETAPGVPSDAYPNGYVYKCITAGLTSSKYNNEDERDDADPSGDYVVWDTDVGDTTTDGEVVWERVAWTEETWTGGIRFKHGSTVSPEYYDPDDTDTFDFSATINDEAKTEDLTVAAIGPGNAYDEYYIAMLGYRDVENLKKFPYSLTIPRDTIKSDSFVPETYASWTSITGSTHVKRVLSKVTYYELNSKFDFFQEFSATPPTSTDQFGLFVLSYDSTSGAWNVEEYHRVSTTPDTFDDNGNNIYIEEKINNDSNIIRVKLSSAAEGAEFTTTLPVSLEGGYSGDVQNFYETATREGNEITLTGELLNAIDLYEEEDIDIDVVIDGDVPLAGKKALASLAEDLNGEAIAILDVPYEYKTEDQIVNWTQENLLLGGETGSYAALYHNRYKILDKYTGTYRWIAGSGILAGIYTEVDKNYYPWYAPAGIRRATIPEVIDIREKFRESQRDVLYANRVNPVAIIRSAVTVYGQKTLLDRDSYLNRVNVRRLLCYLKRRCRRLAEQFVFEFNDEFTRSEVTTIFNSFLNWVKNNRGLEEFLVVCDETNNNVFVRENNEMYVDIYVKPTPFAEFVWLRFYVTKASISLQELATRITP